MVPAASASKAARESVQPAPAEVLPQLQRLLASRPLRESHQLQAFLEFVVHETLAGRSDGLKEYVLGSRVFGRREDYDPRHDGIVRVQATALRKRLEKYYLTEGSGDSLIIELPRGGYVPTFRLREVAELAVETAPADPVVAARPLRISPSLAFLFGCTVTAFAAFLLWRAQPAATPLPFMATKATAADFPQLWGPFLTPGASSLIAYGVPLFFVGDGLYFRDVDVNIPADADRIGKIRKFGEAFKITPQPQDDIYTGVGEVEATYRISNFLATHGIPVRVTNARTLGGSDIAGHNLIVVGSMRFQTLLRDLHLPADFEFVPSHPEIIRNPRPLAGEDREYRFQQGAGISTSYGLVSVWPGTLPGTRILYIGGVHTWSTQATNDFLLQPDELRKMAQQFENDKRTASRGPVSPYFQILLRVEGRGNQSHRVQYVTHHYLPANIVTPGRR